MGISWGGGEGRGCWVSNGAKLGGERVEVVGLVMGLSWGGESIEVVGLVMGLSWGGGRG